MRATLANQLDHDPNFRWRGEAVTRIENLSDIVFALALGMLVSASAPPTDFSSLKAHFLTIFPVAAGFALLVAIWNSHFTFFRRYGVADTWIIILNAALLLVILFFAYPLRLIFDSLLAFMLGIGGDWSRMGSLGLATYADAGVLMGYYCIGYGLVYVIIQSMYAHALRRADDMGLSASERVMTRRSIWNYRAHVLLTVVVGVLAVWTPVGPMAGTFFGMMWPIAVLVEKRLKLPPVEDAAAD
ncbi:MAG: TMEM175 family protein [Hyphomonas sp.]